MTILVVGGAGYIGSHMVQMLAANKLDCVVLDNLSTGFADALTNITGSVELVVGDLADKSLLTQLFAQHEFTAVMHFAAFSQVGESIQLPQKYYSNNLVNTINLLEVMAAHQVKQLVFSSTAAVYGEPVQPVISELHPLAPINPYGRSKLAIEWVLQDYASAYGLKSVALRYFNAAGADPLGANGERHDPETHL
ncbi:MAG: GDP-mannose 4,6-dehydratase, partial [Gammaproteobacteria bacterium]|nr:GDP-mannose 4,6-dehydratase [Gammaproteobacteria bacterium]